MVELDFMPFFVSLLLAEIKRNMRSANYMANLSQKLNRFVVRNYFHEIKEFTTNVVRYHGQDWKNLHS
jgi:hypothetical protein